MCLLIGKFSEIESPAAYGDFPAHEPRARDERGWNLQSPLNLRDAGERRASSLSESGSGVASTAHRPIEDVLGRS